MELERFAPKQGIGLTLGSPQTQNISTLGGRILQLYSLHSPQGRTTYLEEPVEYTNEQTSVSPTHRGVWCPLITSAHLELEEQVSILTLGPSQGLAVQPPF